MSYVMVPSPINAVPETITAVPGTIHAIPASMTTSPAGDIVLPDEADEGDTVELVYVPPGADPSEVKFYDDGVLIDTVVTAPWEASVASITPGAHSYTVRVDGGGHSQAQVLSVTPTTPECTGPADGLTFGIGNTVTLSATADTVANTTKVEWYLDGSTLIGTDTTSAYSQSWDTTGLSAGSHTVTVRRYYTGGSTGTVDSAVSTVTAQETTYPLRRIESLPVSFYRQPMSTSRNVRLLMARAGRTTETFNSEFFDSV